MIRVLHVFGCMDRGGAESRTMDIYRAINRENVQFDFMVHTRDVCHFDSEITDMGGHIYRVPQYGVYNTLTYRNVWESFLREHPEYRAVHIHTTNTAGTILPILFRHGVPMRIVHARSSANHGILRHWVSRLFRVRVNALATHRLAVSREAALYSFGEKALNDGEVQIIRNAIHVFRFQFSQARRDNIRAKMDWPAQTYVIGQVGRLAYMKNHAFILDAFAEFVRTHPNARLVIVGEGPDRDSIEKRIKELGIGDTVQLLGLRKDIPDIMQALDVLALPSLYEGLPGVVLEAQAAGLPCLVSDTVTRECDTGAGIVDFLPIRDGHDTWVRALERCHGMVRKDTSSQVIDAGFDANMCAQWYEKLYMETLT